MNLGVTLKTAEKKFGPALPGQGCPEATLAAIRYPEGKGKKFAGVLGFRSDAVFHIHFPVPVEWNELTTKKGTPDFINDLKESGPQGEQNRHTLVEKFLEQYGAQKEKALAKRAAAAKKEATLKRQEEFAALRIRLHEMVGEHEVTLVIRGESISLPMKITVDKKGKIKLAATL